MSHRQLEFQDERQELEIQLETINSNRHPISLLLDNLADIRNIGAIFRLADAARLEKIYLYNCNFNIKNKRLQRTSRSTLPYVPYQLLSSLEEIEILKKEATLIGLEITNQSQVYTDFIPSQKTILVIGNERHGISEEVLQIVENCIHLPMYGIKTSMNVLCATGIAAYHILEKVKKV